MIQQAKLSLPNEGKKFSFDALFPRRPGKNERVYQEVRNIP